MVCTVARAGRPGWAGWAGLAGRSCLATRARTALRPSLVRWLGPAFGFGPALGLRPALGLGPAFGFGPALGLRPACGCGPVARARLASRSFLAAGGGRPLALAGRRTAEKGARTGVGELSGRRNRRHRAACRHRWRVAQVHRRRRRLAGPLLLVTRGRVTRGRAAGGGVRTWTPRPVRCRTEPAGVADGAEPARIANRPELTRVTDHAEPVSPAVPGKPSCITGTAELVRVAPLRRHIELIAGNVVPWRKLGTPRRGTLSVPWPATVAPRPVTHLFLPVQPLGAGQGRSARLPLFARRSYPSIDVIEGGNRGRQLIRKTNLRAKNGEVEEDRTALAATA